jgi:hypothetical protein
MQVALKTTAKKHRATLNGAIGFAETATLYETAQQITQNPKENPQLYQQLHTFGVWDALIQS